jgi:lysophospholipase L1-like esterase
LGCFQTHTIASGPVRIMPLGDSITEGVGSINFNGYRKPLYQSLVTNGCNFDFVGTQTSGDFPDPHHEGHGGYHAKRPDTIYDIHDQVYGWLVAHPADIILLHIGTNDISVGGQSANEISNILDEIDRFSTDIKVILALIIDRQTHSPVTTQFNIDVNNMAQSRIATGDDITIVDMEHALNYATDMYDYLHPNDVGYPKMANVWFNTLDSIINPPSITSEPIVIATVYQLYSYDVDIDANCYPQPTYALTVCPNGMTIDPNTGLIEWQPTVTGDFNVTVEASNGQPPDANQSFVITVDHSIKFDAASSASSSSNGTTLIWQHTIGNNDNRILVVGVAGEDNDTSSDLVISSVKYDDVNMALVEGSGEIVSSVGTYMKTELYYLLDANLPLLPGDYNVIVTYSGDVSKRCAGAISLANVEQQAREAVATNSNVDQDTISTNITTQTDNAWVVDVVGCGNNGSFFTNAEGMVMRFDANSDSSTTASSTKLVEAAQETTMSWSFSGANRLAHSAAAFVPISYIISGYISEPNEMPVEGVLVSADANGGYDTNDITDANGYYEVWVPSQWSGKITPIKDGNLFTPADRTYSNVIMDWQEQNYQELSNYDLDDNGSIGWGDVGVICDNWLNLGPNIPGDIYKDDIVNFLDFAEFAKVW